MVVICSANRGASILSMNYEFKWKQVFHFVGAKIDNIFEKKEKKEGERRGKGGKGGERRRKGGREGGEEGKGKEGKGRKERKGKGEGGKTRRE